MSPSCVCLYVLRTRSEFEIVSETTEAQKPMNACLSSLRTKPCGGGRLADRMLYVANQG